MIVVSILIGLITDSVNDYMNALEAGSTKCVERGHTLILGWNEATTRVICQTAFLRRTFKMQNDTWAQRLMPWRQVKASTPVAQSNIVVMSKVAEKMMMQKTVREAFAQRGIEPHFTKIGKDVVFRTGDPSNNHDLVRVAAHHVRTERDEGRGSRQAWDVRFETLFFFTPSPFLFRPQATSVMIMMTDVDEEEEAASVGRVSNSATVRTVLALRNVVFSNGLDVATSFQPDLRVVVQLSRSCNYLKHASFVALDGHNCLYPQDLSKCVFSFNCNIHGAGKSSVVAIFILLTLIFAFPARTYRYVNSLLFFCSTKPGLSRVMMNLLDFEHSAIR